MFLRFLLLVSALLALLSLASTGSDRGSCPPLLPVDICEPACGEHNSCNYPQLCCPTACGGTMCVDPMTQRVNVTLVKDGQCPDNPQGPWVCTDTCTSDSDCKRLLKCCRNRCGALKCMKPSFDDDE